MLLTAACALLLAPLQEQDTAGAAGLVAPPKEAQGDLRVLSINLWQEGTSVEGGFEKIVEVILASGADLVVMSEVRNYEGQDLHGRLLGALAERGATYHGRHGGGDVGLLSRFPIAATGVAAPADGDAEDAKRAGPVMAFDVTLAEGEPPLVVCAAHLDYRNYALYLPRGYDPVTFELRDVDGDGEPDPVTDVEALHRADAASGRDEAVEAFLAYARTRKKDKARVLLAGDFNEASHLDWTPATRDLFGHGGVAIEWRNSKRLARAGFVDAWRELHPDPVTHPGHTWPSPAHGRPSTTWTPKADERDRIDFVYHDGGFEVRRAWVVGPREDSVMGAVVDGGTECPRVLFGLEWPSDHKAVLVDLR